MGHAPFKITVAVFVLILALTAAFVLDKQENLPIKELIVGGSQLTIEIADTLATQRQGLSGRDKLDFDRGMLFVYEDKQIRNYWMKDMKFPLDVLWITDDKVVGLQENIQFMQDRASVERFRSKQAVDKVLEVQAGWIAKNGVKIGDMVDFGQD